MEAKKYSPAAQPGAVPAVFDFAAKVLRPFIHIFLRYGMSCEEINNLVRWLAVDVVKNNKEFWNRPKPYNSHVSVKTGLSRKEVQRLSSQESPYEAIPTRHRNRAARVMEGWRTDPRFQDENGKPRRLSYIADKGPSFYQLVREWGADVPPKSVLAELIENGFVIEIGEKQYELAGPTFIPQQDLEKLLEVMGTICAAFGTTVQHDMRTGNFDRRLLRLFYHRYVPIEEVEALKEKIEATLVKYAVELDDATVCFSHKDPLHGKNYQRVGFGIYYFQDDSEG